MQLALFTAFAVHEFLKLLVLVSALNCGSYTRLVRVFTEVLKVWTSKW